MQSTEENAQKFHQMVLQNQNLGIESIVQGTGSSMVTIHAVLRGHLPTSEVWARRVLRMLTPKPRNARATISTALLTWYNTDPELFHSRMVIGDEVWVNHNNAVSKFECMERKHAVFLSKRNCSRSHATPRNLRQLYYRTVKGWWMWISCIKVWQWAGNILLVCFCTAGIHQKGAQGRTSALSSSANKISLPYISTKLPCMLCAIVGVNCYHIHRIFSTWLVHFLGNRTFFL